MDLLNECQATFFQAAILLVFPEQRHGDVSLIWQPWSNCRFND